MSFLGKKSFLALAHNLLIKNCKKSAFKLVFSIYLDLHLFYFINSTCNHAGTRKLWSPKGPRNTPTTVAVCITTTSRGGMLVARSRPKSFLILSNSECGKSSVKRNKLKVLKFVFCVQLSYVLVSFCVSTNQ